MISECNLLFWRLDLAYFRGKKDLTFDDLAGSVKKTAIPQHARPPKQINKITQLRTQNIKTATQADYSNAKYHTPSIKLAINSDIC